MYIKYRDNVIANTPLMVVYEFYPSRCNIIALHTYYDKYNGSRTRVTIIL